MNKTYSIRLHSTLKSYVRQRANEECTNESEYIRRLIVHDKKKYELNGQASLQI